MIQELKSQYCFLVTFKMKSLHNEQIIAREQLNSISSGREEERELVGNNLFPTMRTLNEFHGKDVIGSSKEPMWEVKGNKGLIWKSELHYKGVEIGKK